MASTTSGGDMKKAEEIAMSEGGITLFRPEDDMDII